MADLASSPPTSGWNRTLMIQEIQIDGAKPNTVASRFGAMIGPFLAAIVFYWIGAWMGIIAVTKEWLGGKNANIIGIAVASVVVPISAYVYAAYVCKAISKYKLSVTTHGFRINAMRLPGFTTKEFDFENDDVERVVYGQRLNGMERFLDRLNELGFLRTSQHILKDLNKGRLCIMLRDGTRCDFQLLDKAFDSVQLMEFFSALDENDIAIDHSG
jgi:hypothetical protein